MKTKKYYVQPNVKVIDINGQSILAGSGEWDGTPEVELPEMPGEQ